MNDDSTWLARAVTLARENVPAGGGPFGSLVVRDGVEIGSGPNRVTASLDPTAHAEVVAIRRACAEIGDFSLAGCVLYASCEPCPMCLSASLWARVDRVVYAADRHDAARSGFDDRLFYELFARPREEWAVRVEALRLPTSDDPFRAWMEHEGRSDY